MRYLVALPILGLVLSSFLYIKSNQPKNEVLNASDISESVSLDEPPVATSTPTPEIVVKRFNKTVTNTPVPTQPTQPPQVKTETVVVPQYNQPTYNYPTIVPYVPPSPTPAPYTLANDKWYYCSMTLQRVCEQDQFNPDCQKKYTDETYYCPHGGKHTIAGVISGLQNIGLNDCVCVF